MNHTVFVQEPIQREVKEKKRIKKQLSQWESCKLSFIQTVKNQGFTSFPVVEIRCVLALSQSLF